MTQSGHTQWCNSELGDPWTIIHVEPSFLFPYPIDLFSCIAASLFNKLTYLPPLPFSPSTLVGGEA